MMKWPEHIKRMHEEEIELALKIDRLNEFINGTKFMSLSPLQQRLLEAQQSAMYSYLKILRIRIEVEQDNYRNENDAQSVESYSSRLPRFYSFGVFPQIGRASCRERVCQSV